MPRSREGQLHVCRILLVTLLLSLFGLISGPGLIILAFNAGYQDEEASASGDIRDFQPASINTTAGVPTVGCTICPNSGIDFSIPGISWFPHIGSDVGVYLHSGELLVHSKDLEIPGRGFNWTFERTYRSRIIFNGPLGRSWEFNYNRRLQEVNPINLEYIQTNTFPEAKVGDVVRMDGYGRADLYVKKSDGSYTAPASFYMKLTRNPDGTFVERDKTGGKALYLQPDDRGLAHLASLIDRNGNTMRFQYEMRSIQDQDRSDPVRLLVRAIDTLGRPIDYRYNAQGLLVEVQDFSGRAIRFEFDTAMEVLDHKRFDLLAVTSPAVTGTPNGNDFPKGKTVRYTYSKDFQKERLNHNLLSITARNEVAIGGSPRLVVTYDNDENSPNLDRVVSLSVGGTNQTKIPAGGTIRYQYQNLAKVQPGNFNLAVSQTTVTDRNGNSKEYQFNQAGNIVRSREFTNRKIRPSDLEFFETRFEYNKDSQITKIIQPEGNSVENLFDDKNPDRYQQGNLLSETRIPDAKRGGDQTRIVTSSTFEPIYNQVSMMTEARGNDRSYVPQNGGSNSPDLRRYTTTSTFDYQEGTNFAALARELGVSESEVRTLLAQKGIKMGLGDVNGDGRTDQIAGNVIRIERPAVQLLPACASAELTPDNNNCSLQARLEGTSKQPIIELYHYNQFGQMMKHIDPEGNVDEFKFYPENRPCGIDCPQTSPPADGRALDTTTGGYLFEETRDTVSSPERNSKTNPDPVKIHRQLKYDPVGNVIQEVDGRGILTEFKVNQLNQVVQIIRAAAHDVFTLDPSEPLPLTDFQYLERIFYDFNNNVVLRQVEDRGNTSGVDGSPPAADLPINVPNPDPVGGPAFVDTVYKYDILDKQVERLDEVANGAALEFLRTRFRYDPNENRVLVIQPEGNATASVFDERDLLFQSTRGSLAPPPLALMAADDLKNYNVRGGLASTMTYHYDLNRNLNETVDAADTDSSAANNSKRGGAGDRTRTIYDGFDRRTSEVDSVGNQTVYQYDPASNVVGVSRFGPVGGPSPTSDGPDVIPMPVSSGGVIQANNLVNANLLKATENRYDELSRVFQIDRALFVNTTPTMRPPDVADGAVSIGKLNLTPGDTCAVPGVAAPPSGYRGCVTTRSEYDRNSRTTFTIEDDGDTSRTFYDGASRVIKTVDPEGNMVQTAYDDNNNVIETRETDVSQVPGVPNEVFLTTNFYDSLNRLQKSVDNIGQTFDYRFDSRNNLVAMADASGPPGLIIARRVYSNGARTVNATNLFGNVTRYSYDGINRKTLQEAILTGLLVSTGASNSGDGVHVGASLFGVKNDPSAPESFPPTPDRSQGQGGGDGIIRVGYNYDRNSLLSSLIDDQGNVTLYLYDDLNRRVTETKSLTVNTAPLNKTRILGPRQIVTPTVATINNPTVIPTAQIDTQLAVAQARLSLNAVATLFPPLADRVDEPTTIVFGYDEDDNVLILEDENDSETFSKYDAINRRIAVRVFRAGQSDSHSGDPLFAPAPVSDPSAPRRTFLPVIGTTKQDFEYDGLSRMTRATDNNDPMDPSDDSVITTAYDSLSRVIEEKQKIGALSAKAISSALRAENLRSGLTYPNGRTLNFMFDKLDRLNKVKDESVAKPIADYDYIGKGRVLQRSYPMNGTRMTFLDNAGTADVGYDGLRRIVQLRHLRADNSLVVGFTHTYDRMNNKLNEVKLHNTANKEVYHYDSAYRLIDFERPNAGAIVPLHSDWKLDGVGNWKQVTSTESGAPTPETRKHSSFNEITERKPDGVIAILSDDNGNETDDGTLLLKFDYKNRLRTVTRKADSAVIAVYSYDAVGRRIRKVVTNSGALNGTTDFYLDGWREIEERNVADRLVQQYLFGVYIDEPLVLDRNLNVDGSATGPGDQRLFYHQNTLFSVFALTDTTGKIVEGYQYDAYGRQTVFAPGPNGVVNFGGGDVVTPGVSTVNNPYMYTGRRLDTETLRLDTGIGLYYYRTRYVDTDEGRFISRDTIGFEGGINLYEYVDSEPTAYTDPIGMQKCCCCCIVDAEIKNSKQINDATTWGHSFDVEIKLEYKESDKASDCTLQWWEKTDLMPQWQKDAGLKDNDWNDIYKAFPTSSTFDGWRTGRKKPCPGNETATITDPPALTKVSGRNASRTLYFAIWLKSAPDCPCSNPFKNKVLFANQKLTMKEGKGDAQSFGTAGVPGPWPPPLEEELQKLIKGK